MAYDERLAQIFRDELAGLEGVTEKKMFGGICFLLNGHMLCGVHGGGGMARVGKEREAAALEHAGVTPLSFTGRRMGGMVDISDAALDDREIRSAVIDLATAFVRSLPAK